MPRFETITNDHRRHPYVTFGDRRYNLREVLGPVQPQDVGKRVYLVDGILQVENNEQRDARVRAEKPLMGSEAEARDVLMAAVETVGMFGGVDEAWRDYMEDGETDLVMTVTVRMRARR